MLKKIGIGVLGATLLVGILSYTKMGSYAQTAWGKFRSKVGDQVPVEFEIERLRHELAQLEPDMKKNRSAIAEEIVAIDNLREEIAATRVSLKKQKKQIVQMTDDLESGQTQFVYANRPYTAARVAEKLERDMASYKRCESELKTREQVLETKEKSLEAAREQLASMRDQKQDLALQIERLDAERKTVELAQSRSKVQLDDSRLAELKRSIAEVRNRLKVKKTELDLAGEFANDPIPVEKKTKGVKKLTQEVREYFKGSTSEDKVADGK